MMWEEIERLKARLKELSQEYVALLLNNIEELIRNIDYHSGGRG